LALLGDGALCDRPFCDRSLGDGAVSLDVRLVVLVPLCDGTLGYRTLGNGAFRHWPVTLDVRVLWAALLVCHFRAPPWLAL